MKCLVISIVQAVISESDLLLFTFLQGVEGLLFCSL